MSKLSTKDRIIEFLREHGYDVLSDETSILTIKSEDGFNIFALSDAMQIEFMVDLCGVNEINPNQLLKLYEKILDENTEILPTCFGIDSSDPRDKRIVLVDSLALEDLDRSELLMALDSLAINVATASELIGKYFNKS